MSKSQKYLNQIDSNRTEVVFCVKYNRKIFADQNLKNFLKETFIEIETEFGKVDNETNFYIEELEIFSHYVRMVICYNPHFGIHNAIGRLKRQSAKKLKEFDPTLKSRLPAIWTNQTKFQTIGMRCTEEEIKEYVDSQKG